MKRGQVCRVLVLPSISYDPEHILAPHNGLSVVRLVQPAQERWRGDVIVATCQSGRELFQCRLQVCWSHCCTHAWCLPLHGLGTSVKH